jgi:hypothetical protein
VSFIDKLGLAQEVGIDMYKRELFQLSVGKKIAVCD